MRKLFYIVTGTITLGVAMGSWSLLARTLNPHQHAMPDAVAAGQGINPQESPGTVATGPHLPQAVVDCRAHDFDIMDPGQDGMHEFVLRNEGDSPLELEPGPTTCNCTMAELPERVIPAGKQGKVVVKWNTRYRPAEYFETASVLTNDPLNPKIRFIIRGRVRGQLGLDPPSLAFGKVSPDRPAMCEGIVYSQVWDHFVVEQIESSLPGLTWELEPAAPDALVRLQAKAGYRLRVTLPAEVPQGHFSHWMRLQVNQPAGRPRELPQYEVTLSGQVLRRLCVYGDGIDGTGVVYLGPTESGRGWRRKLLMKVRDPERELHVERIETTPPFLEARVSRRPTAAGSDPGLYDLEIEIPADAPDCLFMGFPSGQVRILTRHPRIPELALPVKFAVVKR